MRGTARPTLAVALGILVLVGGCLSLRAAAVPGELLGGSSGNGWNHNASQSDSTPQDRYLGLVQFQTFVYKDRGDAGGYPASLSISTLRTILSPSEEDLREQIREQVRARAQANGIEVSNRVNEGERNLDQGWGTRWFVFDGNVTSGEGFFTRHAEVKILGEVWTCGSSRTSVVAVGLAQTTDVRNIGGQPVLVQPDDTNWRELVADPDGSIGGVEGSTGLVYNVRC